MKVLKVLVHLITFLDSKPKSRQHEFVMTILYEKEDS